MRGCIVNKTYAKAINEAIDQCMNKYDSVIVMGEGVPDPKGIFGTTLGLKEKYGSERVMDLPLSENCFTGVCVGAAINGLRPVLTHQRVDFSLLSMDQIINSAAKWHYMFGSLQSVPLVIKMTIGKGWGQGPQHSQNLHALFSHIPGLKVVMPSTPYDAKGLLISSIEDNNPVIYIDHRWLHNTFGEVPNEYYRVPIGKSRTAKEGSDITIASISYMVNESLKAVDLLRQVGINPEIVDLRTTNPLDYTHLKDSVNKTNNLLVVDLGWKNCGFASEVITRIVEDRGIKLMNNPARLTLPDLYSPSTPALTKYFYNRYTDVARKVIDVLGGNTEKLEKLILLEEEKRTVPLDVPDKDFMGPF